MKKLIIIAFASASIALTSCNGSDKRTGNAGDSSAAKAKGAADTTKASLPGDSAARADPSDTSATDRTKIDSAVHPIH